MRAFLLNTNPRIWFFVLVIGLFFLNYYTKTFLFGPCGMHQWRQADCLSIAKNYYEEGMDFFHPKVHYQGVKDGRAVSECPILNYTVAALWHVFGEHEIIYRLLEYLLFIGAMYLVLITLLRYFNSSLLAFFSVSVFLTSPLLVFYSANFIADVPAFSISTMSFCLFYRFYHEKNMRFFYAALLLGTLAVLMKASALMAIALIGFFSLLDLTGLNRFFGTEALFTKKKLPIASLFLMLSLVFAWYRYALYYNDNNSNNIFLLTVLPIWEMPEAEILRNLKVLFNWLFPVFLNKPMFFLFFALVTYVSANFKNLSPFLRFSFLFSGLFFFVYLAFFFQVFSVHDYYLSNLMFFPLVTLFCFNALLQQKNFMATNIRFARSILFFLLLFNSFHAAAIYRWRMIEDDKMVRWFPFISEDESKLAKYLFWDYGNHIKNIETIKPVLREHGIQREDWVLSIPDQSFNISLYFMDQKGFAVARYHLVEDSLVLDKFMNRNIKYVVISDTLVKRERSFRRHAHRFERFFTKGRVEVLKFK